MATTQLPIDGVFDTATGKLVGFDAGSGAVSVVLEAPKSSVAGTGFDSQGRLLSPSGSVLTSVAPPNEVKRWVNGSAEALFAPHPSRVIRRGGDNLFSFSSSTPTMTNGTAALSSAYAWLSRQTQALTANGAGNMTASWTVSLPAGSYDPSTHYVLSVYNGAGSTSGLSVSLNGASGKSQSWSVSGSGLRPGWNLLFLCSPTDMVARGAATTAGYGNQNGVLNVGTPGGGGMANKAITSISLTFFGPSNGVTHYVDCIQLSTITRPMVCFTYDQAWNDTNPVTGVSNPFLNEVLPAFRQAGLVGGVRYHHQIDASAPGIANVNAALADGWQAYNGTLTRATPVTTADDMFWQYAMNANSAAKYGVLAGGLGSPPGNNTSSDNLVGLSTMPTLGVPFSKGVSHSAIVHGVQGYSNPLSLGVTSMDGLAAAEILALVDAAIACGTHILFFSHFTKGSQTPAELATALAGVVSRRNAGLVDVVGPEDFVAGMYGKL